MSNPNYSQLRAKSQTWARDCVVQLDTIDEGIRRLIAQGMSPSDASRRRATLRQSLRPHDPAIVLGFQLRKFERGATK
jgi:hypothetical protein